MRLSDELQVDDYRDELLDDFIPFATAVWAALPPESRTVPEDGVDTGMDLLSTADVMLFHLCLDLAWIIDDAATKRRLHGTKDPFPLPGEPRPKKTPQESKVDYRRDLDVVPGLADALEAAVHLLPKAAHRSEVRAILSVR